MRIEYHHSIFPLTIFGLGSCQHRDIPPRTVLHEFIEHCQSAKLVINGPSTLGFEVQSYSQQAFNLLIQHLPPVSG